jgi:hypothetical protein
MPQRCIATARAIMSLFLQACAVPDGARIYRDDSVPGGLRTDHDDPPSYNDPSKSGSETALPIQN